MTTRPINIYDLASRSFSVTLNDEHGYIEGITCFDGLDSFSVDSYGRIDITRAGYNVAKGSIPMDNPELCDKFGHLDNLESLDTFAHIYRKLKEDDWCARGVSGFDPGARDRKDEYKLDILQFLDKNVFNTPERQKILQDYMAKDYLTQTVQNGDCSVSVHREIEQRFRRYSSLSADYISAITKGLEYTVQDKEKSYSLKFDKTASGSVWLRFSEGKNELVSGELPDERRSLDKLEDIMDIYKQIKRGNWTAWNKKGEAAWGLGEIKRRKLMLSFMDKYIFNTQESRALLGEYLSEEKDSYDDYRRRLDNNMRRKEEIEKEIESEKNNPHRKPFVIKAIAERVSDKR